MTSADGSLFFSRRVPEECRPTLLDQLEPMLALKAQLEKDDKPYADLAFENPHDPPLPPTSLFHCQHGFTTEKQIILESLQRRRGNSYRSLTKSHIRVTNGAPGGLMIAMKTFSNVGDAIATVVPGDCGCRAVIEGLECSTISVPLCPDFDLHIPSIVHAFRDNLKARILLLTSPNNPSGRLHTSEKLQELATALQDVNQRRARHHRPPIILLSEESYHRIIFPSTRRSFVSPASFYEYTISVYSYAKPFMAPSECLGWLALSPLWPYEKLGMTQRALDAVQISSGWLFPSAIHARCIPTLEKQEEGEDGLNVNLRELEDHRDQLVAALSSHGVHLVFPHVIIPQAGIFVLVRVPEAFLPNHDMDFARLLAERYRILSMPASIIGLPGWARFSVTASAQMIQHTCAAIHAFALDYESNDPSLAKWLPVKED